MASILWYGSGPMSTAQRTLSLSRTNDPPSMCPCGADGDPPFSPTNIAFSLSQLERWIVIGTGPFASHTSGALGYNPAGTSCTQKSARGNILLPAARLSDLGSAIWRRKASRSKYGRMSGRLNRFANHHVA